MIWVMLAHNMPGKLKIQHFFKIMSASMCLYAWQAYTNTKHIYLVKQIPMYNKRNTTVKEVANNKKKIIIHKWLKA